MRKSLFLLSFMVIFPIQASAEERLLTLKEAVSTAIANNPQITASKEIKSSSEFGVLMARSGFLPQMAATLSYSRLTLNQADIPFAYVSATGGTPLGQGLGQSDISSASYNNFVAQVSLNQLIWDFGKTSGAYNSAKAGARGADADLQTTLDDVHFSTIQSYFGVLAFQEALRASLEVRTQKQKHLELAQAQVEAGIRPKIDVTRALADLAQANLDVLRAKNSLQIEKVTLCTTMGLEGCGEYRVEKPEKSPPLPPFRSEDSVKNALKKRPEYRSLNESIHVAEGQLYSAKSAYYPILAASGSVNYTGYMIDDMVYNWVAGGTATWNFFSGLNTMNSVQQANANIRTLKANIADLELSIRLEIESAYLQFNEASEKMSPAKAMLDAARETLEMAEGRYAAGSGNIVEVTDAQATYIQSLSNMIETEHDLEVATAKVIKSLGLLPQFR